MRAGSVLLIASPPRCPTAAAARAEWSKWCPGARRQPRQPTPGKIATSSSRSTTADFGDSAVAGHVVGLAAGALRLDPRHHRVADQATRVDAVLALGQRVVLVAARRHEVVHGHRVGLDRKST